MLTLIRRVVAALVGAVLPLAAQTPPPRWTLVPELRIGGDALTGPEYEFTTIREIAVGPAGAVYVVQGQEQEIRVYDAQGKYVRTIGRQGGGPGEFTGLGSIGFIGDTLYAIDFRGLRRITLFGADGSLISTIAAGASSSPQARTGFFSPSPSVLLPDGSALGGAGYPAHLVSNGQITAAPIFRLTRAASVIDTIAWVPLESGHGSIQSPSRSTFFIQPLSDAPLSVFAGPAARAFVIERGTRSGRSAFRVTAVAAGGDTLWSRSYAYQAVPLESDVADSVLNAFASRMGGGGPGGPPTFTADQVRKALFIPDHQVTVTRAFAAADGSLWLRREEFGETIAWTVIAPDGSLAGALTLPRNVRPMTVIGDRAWGVELDDVDVPLLVRYRIRK